MTDEKVENFRGEIKVHRRKIILYINDVETDLSHLLPKKILDIDGRKVFEPEVDWEIRTAMLMVAREYMKEHYPSFDYEKIC